ncbi:MAG TPA: GAF domain-containing protein, partial [Caldilineaceae bacterium]|nr:GAF domain-containing protein [Caldilineaceae bacterium]
RLKPARAYSRFGAILLYDADSREAFVEAIYPPTALITDLRSNKLRRKIDSTASRIGVSGRVVLTGQPQRVRDVRLDPDYLDLHQSTLSQLSVPLLEGDSVLGVLSLESDVVDAFDAADEEALQLLAELAVIAIRNGRQYQELKQTNGDGQQPMAACHRRPCRQYPR